MSQRHASAGFWLASPPPAVAVELTARRITAVALDDHGSSRTITAHASEPLAADLLTPSLNAPNVSDHQALASAIGTAVQNVARRTRRIALVLPDSVAKVSLIRFEKVPPKAQDLDQLIRWQVRKSAPFRIEDAQIAWQPAAALPGGGREYLVTLARRDIVQSYERACDAAGLHAGLIDIASFNQINAVLAANAESGDWLLVNVAADYATLAVVRDADLLFFRNRTAGADIDLPDLVHQTAMYHEDRLAGGGFSRVVLAGASHLGADETARLQRVLQERIGVSVQPIDFRPAAELSDPIVAGPDLLDVLAAPVGALLRDRMPRRSAGRTVQQVA